MTRDVIGRASELSQRTFLAATGGALAGAAALGLTGRADAGEPKPRRGGPLLIATRSDAFDLDAHRNIMYYVSYPIAYTTQGLPDLNLKLEPSTGIATEWEASKDLLTYTFKLRKGVLFHIWIDVVLVFALGLAQVPRLARLVRDSVLAEKECEYVEASRVIGEGTLFIALRQILPNCLLPVIVQATVYLGFTILVIAALAFLGLVRAAHPGLGYDLNLARDHMETHPYIAMFPGLAISYAVLAFNLFGDGLRDILAPRLTEG